MKRVSNGLCAALPVVGVLTSAARANDAAVRKALEAEYAKLSMAMKTKNMSAVEAAAAPDLTYTMKNGTVQNHKQLSAQMKEQFATTTSVSKSEFKIIKLTVKGNQAIATVSGIYAGTIKGQNEKPQKLSVTTVTEDHWVQTPKGWKVKALKEISSNIMIDGKKLDPNTMQPKK